MARIIFHVEGQTEEQFVDEVLAPHLATFQHVASARLVGNVRARSKRGGIKPWPSVANEIVNHLNSDMGCYATTIVDYYALPDSGNSAWPGRGAAASCAFEDKAPTVVSALKQDLNKRMGSGFNSARFIPFVMMREFEALLFSDPESFAKSIYRPGLAAALHRIRDSFATPEETNDSRETAPSKRVEKLLPGYEKPLVGVLAAQAIGLGKVRDECPIFAAWLRELESLP